MTTVGKNHLFVAAIVGVLAMTAISSINSRQAVAQNPHPGSVAVNVVGPLPLPLENVDERGRTPYSVRLSCANFTQGSCQAPAPAVPAGKRLVLEHLNAFIQLRAPGVVSSYGLSWTDDDQVELPASQSAGSVGGINYTNWVVNESVLVFADAGDIPQISINSSSRSVSTTAHLSGYVVDLTR